MIYLYFFVSLITIYIIFKLISRKGKKADDVSINLYYRFQDHPGQYSGNLKAKHGALVFQAQRHDEQVGNIVIKDVKVVGTKIEVNLQQILVLAFKSNEHYSTEMSVRFRIENSRHKDPDFLNCKVKINCMINYQNGAKKAFGVIVPVMGVYVNEAADQSKKQMYNS